MDDLILENRKYKNAYSNSNIGCNPRPDKPIKTTGWSDKRSFKQMHDLNFDKVW